jgi:hypothetical protein
VFGALAAFAGGPFARAFFYPQDKVFDAAVKACEQQKSWTITNIDEKRQMIFFETAGAGVTAGINCTIKVETIPNYGTKVSIPCRARQDMFVAGRDSAVARRVSDQMDKILGVEPAVLPRSKD